MTDSLVRYLTTQNEALYERQTIIASQKRINKPSDDPIGTGKILDYRQTLASIEQYQTNIQGAKTRLEVTESNLDLVDDLLQLAEGIAETETDESTASRQQAAEEVKAIYDQVLDLANLELDGNYLFSGYKTLTAPFSRDDSFTVTYWGDDGDARFIVAQNTEIAIEADGQPLFHNTAGGGISVFDAMRDLIVGLENDDTAAISAQGDMIDKARNQINNIRASNAPIVYQLETTENYWQNYQNKIKDLLGREEEADITQAVVELQSIELAYESTLATTARILQPGLLDFLK